MLHERRGISSDVLPLNYQAYSANTPEMISLESLHDFLISNDQNLALDLWKSHRSASYTHKWLNRKVARALTSGIVASWCQCQPMLVRKRMNDWTWRSNLLGFRSRRKGRYASVLRAGEPYGSYSQCGNAQNNESTPITLSFPRDVL